jgi:hypothetical protein
MIGFGAFVKSIIRVLEEATNGFRRTLGSQRPKLCPIPVHDESRRRR